MTAAGLSIRPADADLVLNPQRSAATTQPVITGLGGRLPSDATLVAYLGPIVSYRQGVYRMEWPPR